MSVAFSSWIIFPIFVNFNFLVADAFDTEQLLSIMEKLKHGHAVDIPKYDFKSYKNGVFPARRVPFFIFCLTSFLFLLSSFALIHFWFHLSGKSLRCHYFRRNTHLSWPTCQRTYEYENICGYRFFFSHPLFFALYQVYVFKWSMFKQVAFTSFSYKSSSRKCLQKFDNVFHTQV